MGVELVLDVETAVKLKKTRTDNLKQREIQSYDPHGLTLSLCSQCICMFCTHRLGVISYLLRQDCSRSSLGLLC